MLGNYILYLILLNVFSAGYHFPSIKGRKNNKVKRTTDNSYPVKEIVLTPINQNMSEFPYNRYSLENDDNIYENYNCTNYAFNNREQLENNILDFPSVSNKCCKTACHHQQSSNPSCQHIHLHFNKTQSEHRTGWKMSCLYIFLVFFILVILLNCFHYHYGLGVYYVNNEETEMMLGGEVIDHKTKHFSSLNMP